MFTLHPRLAEDCYYLGDFTLSALLLAKDANYPWCILVPRRADIREIHQLDTADRQQLLLESCALSVCLEKEFNADKLNVAALGNVVPQLHVHHIARFETDPAWPAPIWGQQVAASYGQENLERVIGFIKSGLSTEKIDWRNLDF